MRQKIQASDGRYLGLDIGGSATRWCLINSRAVVLARGETGGFSGHLAQADVLATAEKALAVIHLQTGNVLRITAGVTGLSRGTAQARQLHLLLQQRFGGADIETMPDIELSCRAAFSDTPGIVVYAGTGSIAAHLTLAGQLITAGGKGVLIDDAGGGYWIAAAAMRAILRQEDTKPGSGWNTVLGQELGKTLGGTDWPVVRQAFYALDRGGIALLALAVGAAARHGDSTAIMLLQAAGAELAGFAQMLLNRVGHLPVILAGRAATLHPAVSDSMRDILRINGYFGVFACLSLDHALTAAQCCLAGPFFNQD